MKELNQQITAYSRYGNEITLEDQRHMLLFFALSNKLSDIKPRKKTLKKSTPHHSPKSLINKLIALYAKHPGQHQLVYNQLVESLNMHQHEDFDAFQRASAETIAHQLMAPDQSDPLSAQQVKLIIDYIHRSPPEHAREVLLRLMQLLGNEATLERESHNSSLGKVLELFTLFLGASTEGTEFWESDFLQAIDELIHKTQASQEPLYTQNIHELFVNIVLNVIGIREGSDTAPMGTSSAEQQQARQEFMLQPLLERLQAPVSQPSADVWLTPPHGFWEQSLFLLITQSATQLLLEGRVNPDTGEQQMLSVSTVMLYGSQALALIMEVLYLQRPTSFVPQDWDFFLHADHYIPLVQQLPFDEETRVALLSHFNSTGNLFNTWVWLDNNQSQYLSAEVLAYEFRQPHHPPKGLRLSIFTLNNGEYHRTTQFDLTFVFNYSELNRSILTPIDMITEDGSVLYCPVIAPEYFPKNWKDMKNRSDLPVLIKALPRIEYWLEQERAWNRAPHGSETSVSEQWLSSLADDVRKQLASACWDQNQPVQSDAQVMAPTAEPSPETAEPSPEAAEPSPQAAEPSPKTAEPLPDTEILSTAWPALTAEPEPKKSVTKSKSKKARSKKVNQRPMEWSDQNQHQLEQLTSEFEPELENHPFTRPAASGQVIVRDYGLLSLNSYKRMLEDYKEKKRYNQLDFWGGLNTLLNQLREIADFISVYEVGRQQEWKKKFIPKKHRNEAIKLESKLLSGMVNGINQLFHAIKPIPSSAYPVRLYLVKEKEDLPYHQNVPLAELANLASRFIGKEGFSVTDLQALVTAVLREELRGLFTEEIWPHLTTLVHLAFRKQESLLPATEIYDSFLIFWQQANEFEDLKTALMASNTLSKLLLNIQIRLTEPQQSTLKSVLNNTWGLIRAEKAKLTSIDAFKDSPLNLSSVNTLLDHLKNNIDQDQLNTKGLYKSWSEEFSHWRHKKLTALKEFKKQHDLCLESKKKKADQALDSLLAQEKRLSELRNKRNNLILKSRKQPSNIKSTSTAIVLTDAPAAAKEDSTGFPACYRRATEAYARGEMHKARTLYEASMKCIGATLYDKAAAWSGMADATFNEIQNQAEQIRKRNKKIKNMLNKLEEANRNLHWPNLSADTINEVALNMLESFEPLTDALETVSRYQTNVINLLQGTIDSEHRVFLDLIRIEARSVAELLSLLKSSKDQIIRVYRLREQVIIQMRTLNRDQAESKEAVIRKKLEVLRKPFENPHDLPPAMDFSFLAPKSRAWAGIQKKNPSATNNNGGGRSPVKRPQENLDNSSQPGVTDGRAARGEKHTLELQKPTFSPAKLPDSDHKIPDGLIPLVNGMDQKLDRLWQVVEGLNRMVAEVELTPNKATADSTAKKQQQKQRQNRRQVIQPEHYHGVTIPGDGNCLYSALTSGLATLDINMTVDELRTTFENILTIIVSIIEGQATEQQPLLWQQLESVTGWSQADIQAILLGHVLSTNASHAQGSTLAFHQQYGETGVVALLPFISNQPIAVQTNNPTNGNQINYYDLELWHDVAPELLRIISNTLPLAETPADPAATTSQIPFFLTHSQGSNELSSHFGIMIHNPEPAEASTQPKALTAILMFAHFLSTHIRRSSQAPP